MRLYFLATSARGKRWNDICACPKEHAARRPHHDHTLHTCNAKTSRYKCSSGNESPVSRHGEGFCILTLDFTLPCHTQHAAYIYIAHMAHMRDALSYELGSFSCIVVIQYTHARTSHSHSCILIDFCASSFCTCHHCYCHRLVGLFSILSATC